MGRLIFVRKIESTQKRNYVTILNYVALKYNFYKNSWWLNKRATKKSFREYFVFMIRLLNIHFSLVSSQINQTYMRVIHRFGVYHILLSNKIMKKFYIDA